MKKILIILILLVPLSCQAASWIFNGSFEDNNDLIDITEDPLVGWDANIHDNFMGETWDWNSDGQYCLKLSSEGFYNADFVAGQQATVSQQVDLTDANKIIFDIYLSSYFYENWDGTKFTAFINIDNSPNDIWTSAIDANGLYYDVNIPVDFLTGTHTLYLGIRAEVTGDLLDYYEAYWDFVKFDTYCGGRGYLASDLNLDCYVDFIDFGLMANKWFRSDLTPADNYLDLEPDGSMNMFDITILAEQWLLCTDWADSNCSNVPLDLSADINIDGIVNFGDYGILTANQPVLTNEKADIDGSGTVDYNDLKIMNDQWLKRNWLYKK